jgi:alpha-glucosidase
VPSDDNLEGFFQVPRHTMNHPDTVAFARELRAVVDEFTDPPRFVVGEVFGDLKTVRSYCGGGHDGLHLVFLFKALSTRFSARSFRELIGEFEAHFPAPLSPTWVFGNHDRPRLMDRLGLTADQAKLLAALQLTTRGVPVIYYGDELGMPHHELPMKHALDPIASRFRFVPRWLQPALRKRGILLNRDACRSPMPWGDGQHAGFSADHVERTWLPVHPASGELNVARQEADPGSLLSCYRRLLRLRSTSGALSAGKLELVGTTGRASDHLLQFRRLHEHASGSEVAHVTLNFSRRELPFSPAEGAVEHRSNLHDGVLGEPPPRIRPFEAIIGFERHG